MLKNLFGINDFSMNVTVTAEQIEIAIVIMIIYLAVKITSWIYKRKLTDAKVRHQWYREEIAELQAERIRLIGSPTQVETVTSTTANKQPA